MKISVGYFLRVTKEYKSRRDNVGDPAGEKKRGVSLPEAGAIELRVREKIAGVIQRHQSNYEAPY